MRKIKESFGVVAVKGGYAIEYILGNSTPEYMGRDGLWVRQKDNAVPFPEQSTAEHYVAAVGEVQR